MVRPEQGLGELPDDAGAAEPGERVVPLQRRDDGTGGESVGRPVMVRDDDVEAERTRMLDLCDRSDPAIDRQHEVEALVGQPRERVRIQAVAFLEPRRQVPGHVGFQLPQEQDRQCRGADPVGVVVAVHTDPLPGLDRGARS